MRTVHLSMLFFLLAACGESKFEEGMRKQKYADSMQVVIQQQALQEQVQQLQQQQAADKSAAEQKELKEKKTAELYEVNYAIMETEGQLQDAVGRMDVAKADLVEASRVKLLESENARQKNVKAWSEVVRKREAAVKELEKELADLKSKKSSLEKIIGKQDDTILFDQN